MSQIFLFFWQMCLLRASPARVPASLSLTLLLVAVYAVIASLSINVARPGLTLPSLLGSLLLGIVFEVVLVYVVLWFKKISSRTLPTLASLFATNSIILVFLLLVNLLMVGSDIALVEALATTAFWVIFFWWLAIVGFILHHAMNISVLQGMAIAFTLELVTSLASQTLFPTSTVA